MNSSGLVAELIASIVEIHEARNVRLRQGNRTGSPDVARTSTVPKAINRQFEWKASDLTRKTFAAEFDLHQTDADTGCQGGGGAIEHPL
jgi:hypothetical protein